MTHIVLLYTAVIFVLLSILVYHRKDLLFIFTYKTNSEILLSMSVLAIVFSVILTMTLKKNHKTSLLLLGTVIIMLCILLTKYSNTNENFTSNKDGKSSEGDSDSDDDSEEDSEEDSDDDTNSDDSDDDSDSDGENNSDDEDSDSDNEGFINFKKQYRLNPNIKKLHSAINKLDY